MIPTSILNQKKFSLQFLENQVFNSILDPKLFTFWVRLNIMVGGEWSLSGVPRRQLPLKCTSQSEEFSAFVKAPANGKMALDCQSNWHHFAHLLQMATPRSFSGSSSFRTKKGCQCHHFYCLSKKACIHHRGKKSLAVMSHVMWRKVLDIMTCFFSWAILMILVDLKCLKKANMTLRLALLGL